MKPLLWASTAIFLLAGCSTPIEKKFDLMPISAAKAIFARNGYKSWPEKPYLFEDRICGGERVEVPIEKIDRAVYQPALNQLIFARSFSSRGWGCAHFIRFNNLTEAAALEMTGAARALGAPMETMMINYGLPN